MSYEITLATVRMLSEHGYHRDPAPRRHVPVVLVRDGKPIKLADVQNVRALPIGSGAVLDWYLAKLTSYE